MNSSDNFSELLQAVEEGRNVLLHGSGGTGKCLDPNQGVLMFDGSVKISKDIQVGDLVMGDNSLPRKVLGICEGEDEMYRIETSKGDSFIVNKEHILTLKCSYGNYVKWDQRYKRYRVKFSRNGVRKSKSFSLYKYGTKEKAKILAEKWANEIKNGKEEVIDIPLKEYLTKPSFWKDQYRAFKVGLDFPVKDITLDPYFLGLWLGDGTSVRAEITTADNKIVEWLKNYIKPLNLQIKQGGTKNLNYRIVGSKGFLGTSNFINNQLRKYNLFKNKHIPKDYLINQRSTRIKVLAGLIDSDGHLSCGGYEITQKSEQLANDIVFLARSLGLATTIRKCNKTCTKSKKGPVTGIYHRILIYGQGLEELPLVLKRKKAGPRKQRKNALVYGMKIIPLGRGPYNGFTLDGNGRFLLNNFIVTHNSFCLRKLALHLESRGKTVACTATTGVATVNLRGTEKIMTRTLHSWSGIRLGRASAEKLLSRVQQKKVYRDRWKNTDILIVDEISMLGGSLIEKIDYIGRKMRDPPNRLKGEVTKPFGGLQIIFSGDFLQLPPVKDSWCFNTKTWRELNLYPIVFSEPKRYDDIRYFDLLLRIRRGEANPEDLKLLKKRVEAYDKLQAILQNPKNKDSLLIRPTILFSKRVDVNGYNQRELKKLNSQDYTFTAEDVFTPLKKGIRKVAYTTLIDDMISKSITVKVGAQVMLKANLDVKAGLVNGTRGVVTEICADSLEPIIAVKFLNGKSLRLTRHSWSIEDRNAVMTRLQFPIILAFACTIHKGQGSTLDYAICDLGPSVFAEGQAYVALSRVRNIKGLFISRFYPSVIKANPEALRFEKSLSE